MIDQAKFNDVCRRAGLNMRELGRLAKYKARPTLLENISNGYHEDVKENIIDRIAEACGFQRWEICRDSIVSIGLERAKYIIDTHGVDALVEFLNALDEQKPLLHLSEQKTEYQANNMRLYPYLGVAGPDQKCVHYAGIGQPPAVSQYFNMSGHPDLIGKDPNTYCVSVRDELMSASFSPSDILIISPGKSRIQGETCLLRMKDGDALIRAVNDEDSTRTVLVADGNHVDVVKPSQIKYMHPFAYVNVNMLTSAE